MTNFNKPYFSTSISEFWKRWHISLSTWFRDYLYISLGGNRVALPRVYFNLFFVFLVSGFWHGANWTFVAWGAIHGCYLIAGIVKDKMMGTHKKERKLPAMVTNFVLVALAWVFFRAANIHDALYLLTHLVQGWHPFSGAFYKSSILSLGENDLVYGAFNVALGLMLIIGLLAAERFTRENVPLDVLTRRSPVVRLCFYSVFVLFILFLGVFKNSEFIYFQF